MNKGLRSGAIPDEDAEVGHCVHRLARHPSRPEVLYMQKHWDVMKSKDAGESWEEVSGDLPTDFGFAIDVHAHEPETVYVVPIKSDSEHFPPEGKLRVYRSRSGGNEWEPLTKGLPQANCYVNVLRDRDGGRLTRVLRGLLRHDRGPGLRILRFWRQLGPDSARSPARPLCRGADLVTVRVVLPTHLRELAGAGREVALEVAGPVTQRTLLCALEARFPMLKGTIRDPITQQRRAFVRFSRWRTTGRMSRPMRLSPRPWRTAQSRSSLSGRWQAAEEDVSRQIVSRRARVPSSMACPQYARHIDGPPTNERDRRRGSGPGDRLVVLRGAGAVILHEEPA